jgi:cytochrome P450
LPTPGPPRLPGIGNALQLRPRSLHLTAERWCRCHGPIYRFNLGRRPVVAVGDPEAINAILRDRPEGFRRWRELGSIAEVGIIGVFTAEADDWRRQRRLAVTALNTNHLQRYFAVIRLATERLWRRLDVAARDGQGFAIEHVFSAYTIDVTTALALGRDPNAPERSTDELRSHIDAVFAVLARRVSAPVPYWRYVRGPADRALERSLAELRTAAGRYIDQARERMRERPELHQRPENFLEGMLAAQEAEGRYSEQELFGNTLTMLLAGEDTTAHALAWTSWLLARNPDIQRRLAREARELLGEQRYPAEHETAARFHYGEAVLRESLRLKPPAPFLFIESLREAEVAGVLIPAGTRLMLLTRHAALKAGSFARPLAFDPERWMSRDDPAHSKAFLAFGAGPRFCPGRNLAFLEGKAALATLARNFEITLDPAAPPVREQFRFTMLPQGLRVRLRQRPAPNAEAADASARSGAPREARGAGSPGRE